MSNNKRGGLNLGKGLGALFEENIGSAPVEETQEKDVQEIEIDKLVPNPFQPRQVFNEEKLQELVESIKEYGIIEPLIVREKGRKYQIVAGERRWRAAKLAGLTQVPVVIRDYNDTKMVEVALIENIQRHDLNPIEEAQGIKRLMSEFNLTQEEAAKKIGRSRVAVTNILRLLNLSQEVQDYITDGSLSMGQAKQLIGLPQEDQQGEIARAIIANGWSSRFTEQVVKLLKEGKELKIIREIIEEEKEEKPKKEKTPVQKDVFCQDFESKLVEILGTKVTVLPKRVNKKGEQGGVIQIEYYSNEDLERIYELLQQEKAESTAIDNKTLFTV